jgi:signal transduction histidine kinase
VPDLPLRAFVEARSRERERLSRILHDGVAGGLTAAGLSLDLLALDISPELTARVREIQATLEETFEAVRELSIEFHPDPATRFHLIPALEALAARFRSRFHGILDARFSQMAEEAMTPEQARACYAVAEAALDNILRHAGAQKVSLLLEHERRNQFLLTTQDDGRGFKESTVTHGTGMAVMEYHVKVAGLKLSVQPVVGKGTRVQIFPADTVLTKKRGSHEDGD